MALVQSCINEEIARNAASAPAPAQPMRRAALIALCSVLCTFAAACASNKDVAKSEPPPADTTAKQTPPPATPAPPPPPATLGEQLGRLDARMHVAPPDSLPILQAQYDSLLDSATATPSAPVVQTGPAMTPPPSLNYEGPDEAVLPDNPDESYVGPDDLKGFRKDEIALLRSTSAPRSGTSTRTTPRREPATRSEPLAPESTPENRTNVATARDRRYVDGVTAARSGKYAQAARDLPAVVASPPPGKKTNAEYALGESLERSGNLTKAAEHYRGAASGTSEMSQKSYVSYCRVLAKSGDRTKARKLLADFINRNPRSAQVVNARRLLQTL